MKSSEPFSQDPVKALGQSITILKIQESTGSMYRLPVDGTQRIKLHVLLLSFILVCLLKRSLSAYLFIMMDLCVTF